MFKYLVFVFLATQVFSQTISCQFGEIKLEVDRENNFKQSNIFDPQGKVLTGRMIGESTWNEWVFIDGEYLSVSRILRLSINRMGGRATMTVGKYGINGFCDWDWSV